MIISAADWSEYVNKLARVNTKAAELMQAWIDANGTDNINALFEYAYALSTKYGEAAASLACEMYDSIALAQGVSLPPALPAETAKIGEVKHLIGKALQRSPKLVSPEVGKMVKQAGADTMLHNAARDGAEWAWVPHGGETCGLCAILSLKGWRIAGKDLIHNHAEHIHANCQCEFAVRFDGKSSVEGYDPQKYQDMYNGDTIDDDILESMGYDPDRFRHGPVRSEERMRAMRRQIERNRQNDKTKKDNELAIDLLTKSLKNGIVKINISEIKNGLPGKYKPFSVVDKIGYDGKALQRRVYGKDGIAAIDYDTTDHNRPDIHPTGAHRHILDFSKKNIHRNPQRLSEEELKLNNDIIEKGKNYHDEG